MKKATWFVSKGADFIGTNPDTSFPVEGGIGPGCGALIAAIAAATGKEAITAGKPDKVMFEVALRRLGTSTQETAMIGDRLGTDILGADRVGMKTILVLTGVNTAEDMAKSELKPTWVFKGIDALVEVWQNEG